MGGTPVSDAGQPTRKRHLVSRVILRQFCGSRTLLRAFDVQSGKTKLVGPGGVCWIPRLRPADPVAFEAQWRPIQDRMPSAYEALERREELDEHLARPAAPMPCRPPGAESHDLASAPEGVGELPKAIEKTVLRKQQNLAHLDRRFYARHGIWPAGPGLRDLAVDEELSPAPAHTRDHGSRRLCRNYAKAVEIVGADRVGVCVAEEGEFLIGDAPAQSLSSDKPGVGPLGGVSWGEATVIVMPISRHLAISTEPEGGYIALDAHGVQVLNQVEAASAFRHIIWHPSADFTDLVLETRREADEPSG